MAGIADEGTTRLAEAPDTGDDKLLIRFYTKPVKDDALTAAEGRPRFVEQEYIEIMVPGDKDNNVNRPLRDDDKVRFARAYDRWSRTKEQPEDGTPLSMAPFLSPAQVEELRFLKITSIEALANLADVHTGKFMGLTDLKKRAALFVETAKGNAPSIKLQAELDKRDNEIATLKQMLKEQSDKIEQLLKQRR